jgi:hypothetical protein
MGTVKIKDIEGEARDIQQLFHDEGCDLSSYIGVDRTSRRISNLWIFGAAFVFFILSCCIWTDIIPGAWNKVAILGDFLLGFLVVALVHYNFKNWVITVIAIAAGLAIISVALGAITPQDAVRDIQQITTKEMGGKVK